MRKEKLGVKDWITVGIFATILLVVKLVTGALGVVPLLCVLTPEINALVGAPVYAVFYSKVKGFGMITVLTAILGLIYTIGGYGWPTFVGALVIGLIADKISSIGNYKNKNTYVAGYCVYALWTVAEYVHIWMAGNSYFEELSKTMGDEFAQEFSRLLPWWSVFPMIILTMIVAWIGTLIGKNMMKKHFDRIDNNEYEYN